MLPNNLHNFTLEPERYDCHAEEIEYRWVVTENSPSDPPRWDFSQIDQIYMNQDVLADDHAYYSRSGWVEDMGIIVGRRKDNIYFMYHNRHYYSMTYSSYANIKICYASKWHDLFWYVLDDTQRQAVSIVLNTRRYPNDITIFTQS
jgi:hypothetical protein